VFSQGANIDCANQRAGVTPANSGEASPAGTVHNGQQVDAPIVDWLKAANQASQDQQLLTLVDPSRIFILPDTSGRRAGHGSDL